MTEVWLVRHGETSWNVEGRVQGWEDIPLNDNGIGQARALGDHLARLAQAGSPIDAIYTSDLERAHHTARIVGEATGLAPVVEPGMRERNFGVLQGLIYSMMDAHQPEAARVWRSRDPDGELPQGETLRAFHTRVIKALNDLAALHPQQRVIVVSHGGAMDVIWRHASQVDLQAPRVAPLLNDSINRLQIGPDRWKIIEWGDVGHLEQSSANDVTP